MASFLGCIGLLVSTFGGMIVAYLAEGFALSVMWGWFIVPLFKVDPITIVQALGVGIIVGMMTRHPNYDEKTRGKSSGYVISYIILDSIVSPLISLGIAWLIYQFR